MYQGSLILVISSSHIIYPSHMRVLHLRVNLISLSVMMKSYHITLNHFTVLAGQSSDAHEWDLLVVVANYAFDSFPSEKHRIQYYLYASYRIQYYLYASYHITSHHITSPLIPTHDLTSSHVHWHPVFRGFVIQVYC